MGQSILDGNLPYIELWDNKPPLAFVPFAFLSWLFGKTIIGIRIGAAVLVAVTAYITLQTGKHFWGKPTGILAAVFCVLFYSYGFGSQNLLPEIIASVPLMGAVAIGVTGKRDTKSYFIIGLLISLATLVTMSLAYLSVGMGIFFMVQAVRGKESPVRPISMYILGGLIPIVLVSLPYVINGYSQILFDSLVTAPWQYSNSKRSALSSLLYMLGKGFENENGVLWLGFLGGVGVNVIYWKSYSRSHKQGLIFMTTFFLATIFSIINSGGGFSHYLIHLTGFLALIAGQFYVYLSRHISRLAVAVILIYSLINSTSAWQSKKRSLYVHYVKLADRLKNNLPLSSGTGYELGVYLRQENPEKEPMYLMDFHIAHWFTDTKSLTRIVTHPSNIQREFLLKVVRRNPQASVASEMTELLGKKPRFIVRKKEIYYLRNRHEARKMLDETLQADYSLVKVIGKAHVYKRNDMPNRSHTP